MKRAALIAATSLSLILSAGLAQAERITISTKMKSFGSRGAYAAIYLTDPKGKVHQTFWVAGYKSKYYKHLRSWFSGGKQARAGINSITGASVGSGRTLSVTVDIADNLIAAGYQVRVDASVEDKGDYPRAAILTLNKETSVRGRGVVRKLSVSR